MNKRPEGVSRNAELEKELTADIVKQKVEVETGKFEKTNTPQSRNARKSNLTFQIKQGKRRRHPDTVLNQFQTIVKQTSNASSAWEKALMHEQQRILIPPEYKAKDEGMVANQVGVVTTALDNYVKSKAKFERVSPVGY